MIKSLLKRCGFIHVSSIDSEIEARKKANQEIRLEKELAFNNRVFVGMPVIGINNYENVIEIAIIHSFDFLVKKNDKEIIPIMKMYYSNRTDNFHKDKENCTLSHYVAFTEQRLKAYLKMTGCERTAMLIKSYQFGTEEIEGISVLAPYQPTAEEVMKALSQTSFFEDSKGYDV